MRNTQAVEDYPMSEPSGVQVETLLHLDPRCFSFAETSSLAAVTPYLYCKECFAYSYGFVDSSALIFRDHRDSG